MPPRKKSSPFMRLLRLRLVIPLLRGRHAAQNTSRGCAVGLAVAMTPTVGIQMAMCLVIWLAVRAIRPAWTFNLLVAAGWTWITNIFTLPPIYYGFLVTGRLMLGNGEGMYGFAEFRTDLDSIMAIETHGYEWLWIYLVKFFELWGVPMFVGCIPWMIIFAWGGYVWSARFLRNFRSAERHKLVEHDPTR
jgi:uncharacterized protein